MRASKHYESLLKASLMYWYTEKCFFPRDEANVYSDRVINDLQTNKDFEEVEE